MAIPTTDRQTIQEQPVGITGLTSAGLPTTPISGSANGDLGVNDGLSSGGLNGTLTLTTANTAYELKVGSTRLANRKLVFCTPNFAGVYWGFSSSVTVATGQPLFLNSTAQWALDATDSNTTIYVVCANAAVTVRVAESP